MGSAACRDPGISPRWHLQYTHTRQIGRVKRAFVGILLIAVAGVAACDTGNGEAAAERLALEQQKQQLIIQYASVQNQIRSAQSQALDDPAIVELQERFYEVLRARMIELDPRAEALLDRAREVGAEVDRLSGPIVLKPGEEPPAATDRAAIGRELASLETTLREVQSEALASPDVAAVFSQLQDSVAAAIVRIDPRTAPALENMKELEGSIAAIDAEIAALD